jgi:hypothetical protein
MTREHLFRAAGGAMILAMFFFLVRRTGERGPLEFSISPTILSHSTSNPQRAERGLLFLRDLSLRLPSGSRIAVVWTGHRSWSEDETVFMTATGFLPSDDVVPAFVLASGDRRDLPDYVASFEGGQDAPDGHYAFSSPLKGGALYRRIR